MMKMYDWQSITVVTLLVVWAYYTMVYFIARWKDDLSVIDIAWPFSFLLFSSILFWEKFLTHENLITYVEYLIYSIIVLWSLRLGTYLLIRNIKKGVEDARYTNWRLQNGPHSMLKAYPFVFMTQMILMLIISLPLFFVFAFYAGHNDQSISGLLVIIGWFISLFGVAYQGIADFQLNKFKKNASKNQIMDRGLWRYSRHPNYFGEMLVWWGLFIIFMGFVSEPILIAIALISPLCISFLLIKVTGAPLIEKRYQDQSQYLDYVNQTNKFIPKISLLFKGRTK